MTRPHRKKLIEVAIPLEAINAAAVREKSIRHGHPSTLHLWWSRKPLAACRAVLFAQLVDDPSSRAEELLADAKLRARAAAELPGRVKAWERGEASARDAAAKPTLEDLAVEIERKRLFAIIEDLVKWENSTDGEVLERARAEIRKSCGEPLPPVYDPFSGGGSIPLEAQRLGLPAYGSDLNPVAVTIGKAMIEIPPKFRNREPVHPGGKERNHYRNAEGLAEDVKFYGAWMREKARERIGHLYPKVDLPSEYGGGRATVIAWLWARTVPSPDPALAGVRAPLVRSFELSKKKGQQSWVVPVVENGNYHFEVRSEALDGKGKARDGTVNRQGAICMVSGAAIPFKYIRQKAKEGQMGQQLMAVVAEGSKGRIYLPPDQLSSDVAHSAALKEKPNLLISHWPGRTNVVEYGLTTFGDLFTDRQLVALNTFSDLVHEARAKIEADALAAFPDPTPLRDGGAGAKAYAEAVSVYLAFIVDKCADYWSSICTWNSPGEKMRNTFGRQAIPMMWDYAEANPFSGSTGNWTAMRDWVLKAVGAFVPRAKGTQVQHDAQTLVYPQNAVISTDPPYYDNIGYADLSDFFFAWMKPLVRPVFPEAFGMLATPKSEELVATPYRHGGKQEAGNFFLQGMSRAIANMAAQSSERFPTTIYYAFKQSEIAREGISSTGWATFLQAVIEAGYAVVGTWPMRTEMANRMIAMGANALANSVILVCRKKDETAETVTRAEFIRALKRQLPPAIAELQAANIAPADMPQSAIGPGMGVFSRYHQVLEADDKPMTVRTALQLINAELDDYLGGVQGEFDADTRFAVTWFEQHGMGKGDYGAADNLARARGISVESVKHAGIVESAAGRVRILNRDELDPEWEPQTDTHPTVWECLQYLVRTHEQGGVSHDTALLLKKTGGRAGAVKDLAYCLYDIAANKRRDAREATAYNALIADWPDLIRDAAAIHDIRGPGQTRMDL